MYVILYIYYIYFLFYIYVKKKKIQENVSQGKPKITGVTFVRNTVPTMVIHLNDIMCFQISSCALSMFSQFILQGCPCLRTGVPREIKD